MFERSMHGCQPNSRLAAGGYDGLRKLCDGHSKVDVGNGLPSVRLPKLLADIRWTLAGGDFEDTVIKDVEAQPCGRDLTRPQSRKQARLLRWADCARRRRKVRSTRCWPTLTWRSVPRRAGPDRLWKSDAAGESAPITSGDARENAAVVSVGCNAARR